MVKEIHVPEIDVPVSIARRRGTRNLRLSVKSDGTIRLTIPYGVTEAFALRFLQSKTDWIIKHSKTPRLLQQDDHIGKSHRLLFTTSATGTIRTRLKQGEVVVHVPTGYAVSHPDVQSAARKASIRAIKKEAERLLPQRLATLSKQHVIDYRSVQLKRLKSRWGSCDNRKNIILNIYLMQLDWHLIDYVMLHELAHTYHQHHQPDFWQFVEQICPNWKALRKELKTHPTDIFATKF